MSEPVVISFGGGKGGIGKTTILSNIGVVLSLNGFSVCFIDADLGGANLHLHLGQRVPKTGLADLFRKKGVTIDDIQQDNVVPNTKLISSAGELLNLTNPKYTQKQKLIKAFKEIKNDFILIDLGAGSSSNSTDFFTAYNHGVIVSDTLPASIENAYMFLKNSIIRGMLRLFSGNNIIKQLILDYSNMRIEKTISTIQELIESISQEDREAGMTAKKWLNSKTFYLVLNMIKEPNEISAGKKFIEIVKKYLNVSIHYIGYVLNDDDMRACAKKSVPLMLSDPSEMTYNSLIAITNNLIAITRGTDK